MIWNWWKPEAEWLPPLCFTVWTTETELYLYQVLNHTRDYKSCWLGALAVISFAEPQHMLFSGVSTQRKAERTLIFGDENPTGNLELVTILRVIWTIVKKFNAELENSLKNINFYLSNANPKLKDLPSFLKLQSFNQCLTMLKKHKIKSLSPN